MAKGFHVRGRRLRRAAPFVRNDDWWYLVRILYEYGIGPGEQGRHAVPTTDRGGNSSRKVYRDGSLAGMI